MDVDSLIAQNHADLDALAADLGLPSSYSRERLCEALLRTVVAVPRPQGTAAADAVKREYDLIGRGR